MVTALHDAVGATVRPEDDGPRPQPEPPLSWAPPEAARALAVGFAEALARRPDIADAVAEAIRLEIDTGLLAAGCVYEVHREGHLVPRVRAGFACAERTLRDLCGQAWLLGDTLDSGLVVHVPSAGVPPPVAVDLLRYAGATSALVVPLIALGERVGVLVLASRDVDLAAEALVSSARLVGAQLARALADERVLQQSRTAEQRHRSAFEHARDALVLLDRDSRIIEVNRQAEHLFAASAAELLGHHLAEHVPAEDLLTANALHAQLLAQGHLDVHRLRLRRRDGHVVDVDATAARVPSNGRFVAVLVLRDMTNRRRARAGLASGEERFRALVESTGDTYFTLDNGLRVTAVFGRSPGDAGLDAQESVGKSLGDALARAGAEHLAAARQALLGGPATFEWRASAAADARTLQTTISPVTAYDGDVRSLVGVTRDVTARRQLETRLLVADHLATIGLFVQDLAHELSTPITDVLANLSHLNEILADVQTLALSRAGERAEGLVELIHAELPLRDAFLAGDQLRRIVKALHSLTREERLGPVAVAPLLDAAARMAAPVLKARARLVCQYEDGLCTLGNEALLIQVFLNLIVNAAQACPERGAAGHEVRLTTWRDERGRVVAEVRDDGAGIAPEHRGRIFEPYFTTKPLGVGTGLGLSIAQRLVAALGGDVEVDSQPGVGTAIRVVLTPAAPPAAPPVDRWGDVPQA
jgi:PAS domain S-box-containing protein